MAKQPQPLPAPAASILPTPAPRGVLIASYLLMAGALFLVMWEHLLPGLLCVCIGYLATRWFSHVLNKGLRRVPPLRTCPASPAMATRTSSRSPPVRDSP